MSAATGAGCAMAIQYFLRVAPGIQGNKPVESPSLISEGPSFSGANPEGKGESQLIECGDQNMRNDDE